MASNVPTARDAELAHLSGPELVRLLRTTFRKADYEAVERVLSAREGRATEAETQLKAALAENDAMRKEQDARRRAQLADETEKAAHLGRIAAGVEAHLKAALAEIDALRKKHEAPPAVPQDEAAPTPIQRMNAPAAVPQDEAEETALLLLQMSTSPVFALAAVPHDEAEEMPLLGIASSPVLALTAVPHDEVEETPLLGIASSPVRALAAVPHDDLPGIASSPFLALTAVPHDEAEETPLLGIPAPDPVPQDEQRVVDGEERDENGIERIVLSSDEDEGPRAEGSGVYRKRMADADEDDEDEGDTIPLSQRFKRLRETMAPPQGSALRINASPMTPETLGLYAYPGLAMSSRVRSARVTVSKRGRSSKASDKTRKARTDSQERENKTRTAGNSPRTRNVGGRGRGRGRGRGTHKTLQKPAPATTSHSNFRCWLQLPASSSASSFVGGNPGASSSTVVAPAVVSLEENRMPSSPPLSFRNISGAGLRNMSNNAAVANDQQLQSASSDNGLHVDDVKPTRVGELGQKQQEGDGEEVA